MRCCYLDTSALVKLVVPEAESETLVATLRAEPTIVTSQVGEIEFARAARRVDHDPEQLDRVMERLTILPVHVANAAVAAAILPLSLKSLDALHLAAALEIVDDLDAFYCYDQRLAEAARGYGLRVVAPA